MAQKAPILGILTFFRHTQGENKNMRLKALRKKKRITQLKLAMDLNISQNTISRYEKGIREADYAMLIKLADYFHVSIDYLLERTDDPTFHP